MRTIFSRCLSVHVIVISSMGFMASYGRLLAIGTNMHSISIRLWSSKPAIVVWVSISIKGLRRNPEVVGAIRIGEELIQTPLCSRLPNTNKTHYPNVFPVVHDIKQMVKYDCWPTGFHWWPRLILLCGQVCCFEIMGFTHESQFLQ